MVSVVVPGKGGGGGTGNRAEIGVGRGEGDGSGRDAEADVGGGRANERGSRAGPARFANRWLPRIRGKENRYGYPRKHVF